MFTATVIVSALLAAMAVMSASMKLQKNEKVITAIHTTVGVPLTYIPVLAACELAGAAGVLIGLRVAPLGIAAATGLTAYFAGAIISHLRVHDTKGMASPVIPLVLAIAALVLRAATA